VRPALALGVALVVAQALLHYRECDESANTLPADFTVNLLESVPPGSVVFTTLWDFAYSPSMYLQTIERRRPDVLMVNVELMQRSWYVDQIGRAAPWFVARAAPQIAEFLRAVEPFEHHRSYRSDTIEAAYRGMVDSLMSRHMADRPVFVTYDVPLKFGR